MYDVSGRTYEVNFTTSAAGLTTNVAPEPGFYGVLAIGLSGLGSIRWPPQKKLCKARHPPLIYGSLRPTPQALLFCAQYHLVFGSPVWPEGLVAQPSGCGISRLPRSSANKHVRRFGWKAHSNLKMVGIGPRCVQFSPPCQSISPQKSRSSLHFHQILGKRL